MKKHVERMIDKFNPTTGLKINKSGKFIGKDEENLDKLEVLYDFKGHVKYINHILLNFYDAIAIDHDSERDDEFAIQMTTDFDSAGNEIPVVMIINVDNKKFKDNNMVVMPRDYPHIEEVMITDNHLRFRVKMNRATICNSDIEIIERIDDVIKSRFNQKNIDMINEDIDKLIDTKLFEQFAIGYDTEPTKKVKKTKSKTKKEN